MDAHAVSIGDGAIALHNAAGVPLRSLGTGSSRLLVAGMQRAAAQRASVALVDEVEYGLEPHRLTRLLNSLGARETPPPLQVFLTTHSPVAVRELPDAGVDALLQRVMLLGRRGGYYSIQTEHHLPRQTLKSLAAVTMLRKFV
ncbi:TPA: AAA family ATPase [Serratia marcescens]